MKIGFISEYYPPFAPGGAEWSSYYLAQDLSYDNDVVVITPNYSKQNIKDEGSTKIVRFPFYKKLKNPKDIFSPFVHNNPIWVLWSSYFIYKIARSEKFDIIHIQGKFSVVPVKIANIFLRLPIVLTARDYQLICNYGFCIYDRDRSCNLKEYFMKDFNYYFRNYVKNKNIISFSLNLFYAIWGRIIRNILKNAALNMNIIVLSNKQKQIFFKNGFKNIFVIGNSTEFKFKKPLKKRENSIVFAGRLTLGKGVGLIIDLLPKFFKKFPDYKFYFAGDGPFMNELMNLKSKYPQIKVLGTVKHKSLINLYRHAKVVVMPSVWHEPFGRIALESLSTFTPVIVTNKGGLPEIVKDGRLGHVVKADSVEILEGIIKAIKFNDKMIYNIEKDFPIIKKKFGPNISSEYLNLYKKLI